jgi:hypothetical protein
MAVLPADAVAGVHLQAEDTPIPWPATFLRGRSTRLDSGARPEDLRKPTKNERLQDVRGASGMADRRRRMRDPSRPANAGRAFPRSL